MGTDDADQAAAAAALRSGRWAEARDGFAAALLGGTDPVAFEGLAQASWWLDDGVTCVEAREAAYRAYRERGDGRAAARVAADLAYDSLLFGQGAAVSRGWLARAHGLLERLPEGEEHGWLLVRRAELALAVEHDVDAALSAAERAEAIGNRLDVGDLRFVGLALSGLALASGDLPARGMDALDAAVAAATAGDVEDLMWMGKICCWMIAACQETQDLNRADDWCRRVEAICERRQLTPLFSVCRIQYSSVLVARGTWPEAERTLISVLDQFASSRRQTRVDAIVQLGELRRRQGRLTEADELLRQAEFHPVAVAGRSLIRLARGDATSAWAAMRALLATLPPANRLARARVLLPAVIAATEADDLEAAQAATDELQATASDVGTDPLLGLAAVAAATIVRGDGQPLWREAVRRFHDAGLSFDEAESRLGLATALLAAGDHAGAAEQAVSATSLLRALGATSGLAQAEQLAREAQLAGAAAARDGVPTGPLTPRETEVMRLVAEGLSNPQIAAALVVSEHTVHRHVANILTKLDQPTRAAATAYAVTHRLV